MPEEDNLSENSNKDPPGPIKPSATLAMPEPEQPMKHHQQKRSVGEIISNTEEKMRRIKRETMKGKEFWSGVCNRTYKQEESQTWKVTRTKKGSTAQEPALTSFGVFLSTEEPTKKEGSADVNKIKENETYPEEEPREECNPTPEEQKNEPYDKPGEPDGG